MAEFLGCRVSEELESLVKAQARSEGREYSDVMREALELYLSVAGRKWRVLDEDMMKVVSETAQREGRKPSQVVREAVYEVATGRRWEALVEVMVGKAMETRTLILGVARKLTKGGIIDTVDEQVTKENEAKAREVVAQVLERGRRTQV